MTKKIAAAAAHADIPDRFPGNARTHQGSQKVPVIGAVPLKEVGSQAHAGRIPLPQAAFLQIFRQVHQHFSLGILVAAEGMKPLRRAEEVSGKGLLPLGKEAGAGRNVPVDSGVYFVPELGQEQPVLGTLGDFFDFASIHVITTDKYNTFSAG